MSEMQTNVRRDSPSINPSGPSATSSASGSPGGGTAARRDPLSELQSLLIGREQRQIAEMQREIAELSNVSVDEVAAVLPQALIQSANGGPARQGAHQLHEALLPVVEEDLALSARRNPAKLAGVLFPVMGPAIRKAIRETISSMIQSLNETLDHSLSPRGVQWRLEAWRSGKPFSEVVFLKTMLFKVEQVFLIHRETGLMLEYAATPQAPVKDAEAVSGMLTAIQDFVRDSFTTRETDGPDSLSVGDVTVVIEQGPSACVAGVVRGHPPRDLRQVFRDALAEIHREHADALRAFSGDTSPFVTTRPHLERCLRSQINPKVQAATGLRRIKPVYVLALLLLVGLGTWGFFQLRSAWRWQRYVDRLRQEPGIVVTTAEHGWVRSQIEGLRDPLARHPNAFLAESGLDPADVDSRWRPYQAIDPPFTLMRAQTLLSPPSTVSMQLSPEGVLEASGAASSRWIADARRLVALLPGVTRFKDDRLADADVQRLQQQREKVQAYNILFAESTATPLASQRQNMANLTADLAQLVALANALNQPASSGSSGQPGAPGSSVSPGQGSSASSAPSIEIQVIGHTDGSGAESLNRELSRHRADIVLAAMRPALPPLQPHVRLAAVGVLNGDPARPELTDDDRARNRRVTVRLISRLVESPR